MKTNPPTDTPQKLSSEVHLARLRLAQVESRLTTAREQARLARRRRKEAKQAARRAKKEARLAKEQVAGAKLALAELEARLAQLRQAQIQRKPRRPSAKKVAVAPRRKSPVRAAVIESRETLKLRKPIVRQAKSKAKSVLTGEAGKSSITAPGESETPVVVVPPPVGKPTDQIVKGVEESFTGEIQAESPVEPGVQESLAPQDENPPTPNQTAAHSTINPQETP